MRTATRARTPGRSRTTDSTTDSEMGEARADRV